MSIEGVMGFRKTIEGNTITKSTFLHYDAYPEFTGEQMIEYLNSKSLEEINQDFDKIILVEPTEDFPEGKDESEQLQLENYSDYDLTNLTRSLPLQRSKW